MSDNKDIAVLAKKVYELSVLPVETLDARKWEALLIPNAVYSSATPDGIDKANADKAARWGVQIAMWSEARKTSLNLVPSVTPNLLRAARFEQGRAEQYR